jgi:hypothetical protein
LIHWNKLKIQPTDDMTDADVRDFVEWVTKKAERLGFSVEFWLWVLRSSKPQPVGYQ